MPQPQPQQMTHSRGSYEQTRSDQPLPRPFLPVASLETTGWCQRSKHRIVSRRHRVHSVQKRSRALVQAGLGW